MTMPLFPVQTDWVAPSTFPDLSGASEIAIDLETCDPHLEDMGPGWPRKDGYVVGYAVAVEGWKGYYPVAHEGGGNLDKRMVERWIQEVLSTRADKVMHNAAYDMGWLLATGFTISGRIRDTSIAAPLIDENRFGYSLNALGFDYLKEIKSEQGLKQAANDFGVHPKKGLWRLPAMYVGNYAEQDAALTLKLWQHFKILLRQEESESIFELESELLPILVNMTYRGVRFDRLKCAQMLDTFRNRERELLKQMRSAVGSSVEIWAAESVAHAFDKLGIQYGKTAQGAPSFTKGFLENHEHPFAQTIVEARELNKTHGTFLEPYLKFSEATGRMHPHINQLRSDEGGTVSGRLSMYAPNLQQVPSRHPTIGPMIRSLFLPEEGQLWASADFSSQEPRLLVHYAALLNLPGAHKMVDAYNLDPNTDFHQMVADMAGIGRKQAKTIGLGLMYGMGKAKLAGSLGLELDEASALIDTLHQRVPFLRGTIDAVVRRIEHPGTSGSIRTLLGRKCRFPLWEPMAWGVNKALPREQAIMQYGARIKRAGTYKGLNRLIQGSAADQTKASLVAAVRAGVATPMLQIHDEVAFSVVDKKAAEEAAALMRDSVKLLVPSRVDVEVGTSWGDSMG